MRFVREYDASIDAQPSRMDVWMVEGMMANQYMGPSGNPPWMSPPVNWYLEDAVVQVSKTHDNLWLFGPPTPEKPDAWPGPSAKPETASMVWSERGHGLEPEVASGTLAFKQDAFKLAMGDTITLNVGPTTINNTIQIRSTPTMMLEWRDVGVEGLTRRVVDALEREVNHRPYGEAYRSYPGHDVERKTMVMACTARPSMDRSRVLAAEAEGVGRALGRGIGHWSEMVKMTPRNDGHESRVVTTARGVSVCGTSYYQVTTDQWAYQFEVRGR